MFVPQMLASVTLGNLSSLTFQQKMIMAIQTGCSTLSRMPTLRAIPGQQRHYAHHATYAE